VHSHSQLIATDILPTDVARSANRMALFFEREDECLVCRTVQDELIQRVRVVEETRQFVAYCPFASRLPSLVSIAPKEHHSQMEMLDDDSLGELSWLVHRLIRRIEHCYPETAYNYVIHSAPRCQQNSLSFHWRMELFPRLSTVAGFEWGSECYINPLPPELSAHLLRLAGV
jgi:UDPglucose--hexose-1-phosphate uridylyltransferase